MGDQRQWRIRASGEGAMVYLGGNARRLFSIKVIHDGSFANRPHRVYLNPTVTYVDFLDVNKFNIEDIQDIVRSLGHLDQFYCYFHHDEETLDVGFQILFNRYDVEEFLLKVVQISYHVHTIYAEDFIPNVKEFYPKTLKNAAISRIRQLLDDHVEEDQSGDVFKAKEFLFLSYGVWIPFDRVQEALGQALNDLMGFQTDEC